MSRSTIGIAVAVPAATLFDVARQVERWAELLPHYRSVTVEARRDERILVRMVAMRRFGPFPVPVSWRAEHWPEPDDPADLRLRFRHVRGVTRGMDVTWHVRPTDAGCAVTIEHTFLRPLPLLGPNVLPRLVDAAFVRHIAGRTLATFAGLAESGVDHAANHQA